MLDWNMIHLLAAKGAPLSEGASALRARPPRPERSFVAPALILLAVIVVAFLMAMSVTRKEAEIRALPADARAQILRHGVAELQTLCREPSAADGPLRARCIDEARFVLMLPECGPGCRTAATAALPQPRR
jgi:hypothetical protein